MSLSEWFFLDYLTLEGEGCAFICNVGGTMHTVTLSHSRQFDSSTVMFKISVIFSGILMT